MWSRWHRDARPPGFNPVPSLVRDRPVPEVEIRRAHSAVIAAAELVAVAREPAVETVGKWTNERNLEEP
jgi:hypothetical protein